MCATEDARRETSGSRWLRLRFFVTRTRMTESTAQTDTVHRGPVDSDGGEEDSDMGG